MKTEFTQSTNDTIVARASGTGVGAIGIVRLSGPQAVDIARDLSPGAARRSSHHFSLALVKDEEGALVDEAMVVEMHGPRSYTGEDTVEFHLHGAPHIAEKVIELCQARGARLAGPGEYTLRAFLNNRLDLAQAEAVGELIAARNDAQRRVAVSQLKGGLSREIEGFQGTIEGILARVRAALDFPEYPTGDGIEEGDWGTLQEIKSSIDRIVGNARCDLQRGRRVALCGAPNVGKSSLLNRWAGEERVLVDSTPGTTRDPVEVELGRGLQRWFVWDTAGMREEAQGLEERGIRMARERAYSSDEVLWLVSGLEPVWPEVDRPVWVVGSKADLLSDDEKLRVEASARERNLEWRGWISSVSGEGVDELRARFEEHLDPELGSDEVVVVKERHLSALEEALAAFVRLEEALGNGMSLDILSMELEDIVRHLGSILGKDIDAAVLDRIFADFCIGK